MADTPIRRDGAETLVEQLVRQVASRIDERLLRSGARMPSIRQFALEQQVSPYTVVASYDRLVAHGYLESRRGAGFYVRERAPLNTPRAKPARGPAQRQLDVVWLIRNLFRQVPVDHVPGIGVLPPEWLDGAAVANALRAISRQHTDILINYGVPQGYLPLRQQLQLKLAELEIEASPEQFLTTVGVTQGLDLVARELTQPGDTVFVDDPGFFLMFGSFTAMGLKVVGVPRGPDGPDIARLAELAAAHKPRLYVINSVLHNPTSTSLTAARAFQVLRLAEEYDFTVVEDDIYCDFHPGSAVQPATRLASLDQLKRVIYLGGFSKSLSANLRVGFIACAPEMAQRLADRKMLATLTSSDIGERVVYKILSEGTYRKHVERIRTRLDGVRSRTVRQIEKLGMKVDPVTPAGLFVWVDAGCDTNVLTEKALEQGILLAPGSLFSPKQLPSTRMRLNVAAMHDPAIWKFLERNL
jgi:DNA-binding transcriptional MocR family regulator